MKLPEGDRTPEDFFLYKPTWIEYIKRPLRAIIYPLLTAYRDWHLENKYGFKKKLGVDKVYINQRGNDYEALRKRVDQFFSLQGKRILVAGCGTGKDIESWLSYRPNSVVGVDYFDYSRAWMHEKKRFEAVAPDVQVDFKQIDLNDMRGLNEEKFDVIASDAVFEHLRDFDCSVKQMSSCLKKGGLLYATFGPLWYAWGGDHLGGIGGIENGYNHLSMAGDEYMSYLEGMGKFEHHDGDGRTWIYNDLFSYLKPTEYLSKIEKYGFVKLYASVILEERALLFRAKFPDIFSKLEDKVGFENLIITGMTIIFKKDSDSL